MQATDKTTVLGTSTLLAGAVQHIAEGDYSVATQGNLVASVGKDTTTAVGGSLMEKIGKIRSSIAAVRQDVWVGSQQINVMALMLETLEVVQELAQQTAGPYAQQHRWAAERRPYAQQHRWAAERRRYQRSRREVWPVENQIRASDWIGVLIDR
ncbi:Uncharacterised protein [Serratia odorifera]|uniref:Uncharacterized protein n=1 Tax=Serratia odorifera TaxID=618 RepID=A0A447L1E1_SEROD|nr:Uncharacterised protein [Serratia odorifera]